MTIRERLRLFWWNWVRRPLLNAAWRLRDALDAEKETWK